jgi:hypothetical protein
MPTTKSSQISQDISPPQKKSHHSHKQQQQQLENFFTKKLFLATEIFLSSHCQHIPVVVVVVKTLASRFFPARFAGWLRFFRPSRSRSSLFCRFLSDALQESFFFTQRRQRQRRQQKMLSAFFRHAFQKFLAQRVASFFSCTLVVVVERAKETP